MLFSRVGRQRSYTQNNQFIHFHSDTKSNIPHILPKPIARYQTRFCEMNCAIHAPVFRFCSAFKKCERTCNKEMKVDPQFEITVPVNHLNSDSLCKKVSNAAEQNSEKPEHKKMRQLANYKFRESTVTKLRETRTITGRQDAFVSESTVSCTSDIFVVPAKQKQLLLTTLQKRKLKNDLPAETRDLISASAHCVAIDIVRGQFCSAHVFRKILFFCPETGCFPHFAIF